MNKFDFNVKYDAFKIDSNNVIYGLVNGEWIMLDDSSKDDRVFFDWSNEILLLLSVFF